MQKITNYYYISNVRMPTEKAHGVHMMKMCEALTRVGMPLTFVVPKRFNAIKTDPFEYYNAENIFPIKELPSIDVIKYLPWIGFWIQTISYLKFVALWLLFKSRKDTVIHTREFLIAGIACRLGFNTTYEAHRVLSQKRLFFRIVRKAKRIVTNSEGVAAEFRKRGFKDVRSFPNAVDTREFGFDASKDELRKHFDLPTDNPLVLYTGHLFGWKGIDSVIETAKISPDINFVFVGGTEKDIAKYKTIIKEKGVANAFFLGHKPKKDIPRYLKSADILILPNVPVSVESERYTSPMKLFEYMASGVPIVASDLPSIGEHLNEKNSYLYEAGNAREFKATLEKALTDKEASLEKGRQAKSDAREYTWEKRAEGIVDFTFS